MLVVFFSAINSFNKVQSWSAAGVNFRVDVGEGEFLESDVVGEVFLSLVDKHAEPKEQVLGQHNLRFKK